MRKTLLASATLLGLAFLGQSASAQTTDATPAVTPPASAADQAPPALTAAPDTSAPSSPAPRHHHHHIAASADDTGATHFAHEPGTGVSGPASAKASNIDSADSRSPIAPHLPAPAGGDSAGYITYLHDADHALSVHRTGEAQQALEMAETRLLDRSTPVGTANQPDQTALVQQVSQARQALGHGDSAGARSAIQAALRSVPGARP